MTHHDRTLITSTHWGSFRADLRDGKLVGLKDFETDKDPSPIGQGLLDVLEGPTRIARPAIRKSWLENGPGSNPHLRGKDPFIEVSWEEAETLVAAEYKRVSETFGNQAIFAGSYGWASAGRFHHAQSQIHRFLNCIGGYTRSVNTYSFAAAEVMVPHVLGDFRSFVYDITSWRNIAAHTELMVTFGGIPLKNGQISQGGTASHIQKDSLMSAVNAGVEFINISPLRSDLHDACQAEWIPLRPNADTALMLGLCHTLYDEGLHNADFLARCTAGFDRFERYLLGTDDNVQKSADWAAPLCDMNADDIRALARRMAAKRTMISISWSLTRQHHGEMPYWTAITLAAMLGQIGLPGGGIGFGYSAVNTIGNALRQLDFAALPQGRNAVSSFIPVARISDMLLNPGAEFQYNGTQYHYPDIEMMVWAGGNPFHHHQDLTRMLKAWQKPATILVHDWCWNANARHADIILPCTHPVEREDMALTPRDPYVLSMDKLIEPYCDARDDYSILSGIARQLGAEVAFTEARTAAEWQRWIYDVSRQKVAEQDVTFPDYDTFRAEGWFKIPPPDKDPILMQSFRADPVANPLKTPSGKIEIGSDVIAGFEHSTFPPHPAWEAPAEWLGSADRGTRLHMISNQPVSKLHSQLDHGSVSRAAKIQDRETMTIHPDDAARLQITEHEVVKVVNDRGACLVAAVISDDVMPGVIVISTGAWFDPDYRVGDALADGPLLCKHGNPNMLAPDNGTSCLAQGPGAHSCLVEIMRLASPPPPVTAFDAPNFCARTK